MNKERYFVWKNYEALEELVEGGGPTSTIVEKSITENGTYNASSDEADGYNPVVVNVANSYAAGDEGKVVDNGALVAQTDYGTVTTNGTYNTTTNNSITVNVSSGPVSVPEKDVNFYDYDGTCVYSYTAQEFLALTEMPANPDRTSEGLTAQGWNWSFSDATSYVTDYGKLQIGQMYVTTDGATKLFITLHEGRLNPYLGLNIGGGTATIDWGDNSTPDTMSSSGFIPHTYTTGGDYIISITPSENAGITLPGGSAISSPISYILTKSDTPNETYDAPYRNSIKKIFIGTKVYTTSCSFAKCNNLKYVTIPNTYTSLNQRMFYSSGLETLIIPNTVNLLSKDDSEPLGSCYAQDSTNLKIVSIDKALTNTGVTSLSNSKIPLITISNSSTLIDSETFKNCSLLSSIVIPKLVTSIGSSAFYNCWSLGFIKFTSNTPPTTSYSNTWTNLPTDCILYVPALVSNKYMTASNYPNPSTYNYIGYATYTSGDTLPTLTTDETYTLTWYATVDDAIAGTNPITEGNGSEVYSRATVVT